MSGKVLLKQEVFNYMCEYFKIKNPRIHFEDYCVLSLNEFSFTWKIYDESSLGGFEIEAVLSSSEYPEEDVEKVLQPLIKKYQERFDD
jgi:hypothetical protein